MAKALEEKYAAAHIIWDNVEYIKDLRGISNNDVARIMKISPGTVQNRIKKPQTTSMAEVVRMAQWYGIEPAQMLVPFRPPSVMPHQVQEEAV